MPGLNLCLRENYTLLTSCLQPILTLQLYIVVLVVVRLSLTQWVCWNAVSMICRHTNLSYDHTVVVCGHGKGLVGLTHEKKRHT